MSDICGVPGMSVMYNFILLYSHVIHCIVLDPNMAINSLQLSELKFIAIDGKTASCEVQGCQSCGNGRLKVFYSWMINSSLSLSLSLSAWLNSPIWTVQSHNKRMNE
jgi:hypothetical protein